MQVPGSDNADPGSDILWPELMSEGKETLLEKKKANGIILGCNLILSEIFISEWTLSLTSSLEIYCNKFNSWNYRTQGKYWIASAYICWFYSGLPDSG